MFYIESSLFGPTNNQNTLPGPVTTTKTGRVLRSSVSGLARRLRSSIKASLCVSASFISLHSQIHHSTSQLKCKKIISSSKMATSSFAKCFRGHSLMGGLTTFSSTLQKLSQGTNSSNFLAQQIRTFIQMRTNLKVVDNSGAKRVMCIQALKGKKGARLGDTIVASVKEAQPGGKVKKGQVVYGVVVRAAMQKGRCDGSEVKFDDNAVVLVNKQGEPIGTRVFGPVPHELRKKKHVKILSLAQHIA